MAFCKYSSESVISSSTMVDNIFIHDYLPSLPATVVKIYIYGLYKCANPNAFNNTLESFAEELGLTVLDIENAFLYLQDQGLVNVILGTQFQVRYLPLNNIITNTKKFKKDKYTEFNKQAQEIIDGRMITATEYTEYYTLMEVFHIEPMAFVMVMDYCTKLKGGNVGHAYITTVARNWASEGITTTTAVEEKLRELTHATSEIGDVLKVCGIKRLPTVEEQEKFIRWTKNFGFNIDAIRFVAKSLASKGARVNFDKLDNSLTKFYETKRLSVKEIQDYLNHKAEMLEIAKNVCKTIGVYYENLEIVIETYIANWLELGHTEASLVKLANYCFLNNIRTLKALDDTILKLYKLGVISTEAIDEYIAEVVKQTAEIKEILEKLGLSRNVTARDRDFVSTWKYVWNTSDDVLEFAIEKAVDKSNPMQYINKLLATWRAEGVSTLEEAKRESEKAGKSAGKVAKAGQKVSKNAGGRDYDKADLEQVFKSLDEISI
ncbi:MAG: DnaD domain protein [Clostridia bacterium]|nr:DnaD domain protein [Clostridia bacterium]